MCGWDLKDASGEWLLGGRGTSKASSSLPISFWMLPSLNSPKVRKKKEEARSSIPLRERSFFFKPGKQKWIFLGGVSDGKKRMMEKLWESGRKNIENYFYWGVFFFFF